MLVCVQSHVGRKAAVQHLAAFVGHVDDRVVEYIDDEAVGCDGVISKTCHFKDLLK